MATAAARRELPPRLELLCLKALWSLGEGSVRDVRQVVSRTKPLAYTTVMTLLDRLARRQVVGRRKAGRAFIYAPQLSEDSVRRLAFREFLDDYFDGSADGLLAFLNGNSLPQPPAPAAQTVASADGQLDTVLL